MGNFYSRLSYSFGNEDWKTEQKALQIGPQDRVLCITASGDRPLNLLATPLGELVALDANPTQNALLELKKSALNQLTYSEYLRFLGVHSHPDRRETFQVLKGQLSPEAIQIWEKHWKKIEEGVLYTGAIERWLKKLSRLLAFVCGNKIPTLFSFDSLEEQQHFLRTQWNARAWERAFRWILRPTLARLILKDPGLYQYIDRDHSIGMHIYTRFQAYLQRALAKESVVLSLLFLGQVHPHYFPPYLTHEGFDSIKPRLHTLSCETEDLIKYLEKAPAASFDRFSLSDVASYISKEEFTRLITAMIRTAKPGARFCIRQFLAAHPIPAHLAHHLQREPALEATLEQEDCCFVYRFLVGTIHA